jgi:S-DNA-T family DNA segregation ATPase FtsK/SpoIIIE
VWPEGRPEVHPGRLVLWVGDQDMASARQPAWPLLKSGTGDLFKPFPFGTDPRGRTVSMDLMYTNVLIGSIPGVGKTFSLRVPLLAAALDPRAELWVFELKGTGDLDPLALVASRYASGPDDDTLEDTLDALRELRRECQRRATVIKGLPKAACPENKVTPELARKSLGLHPLVMAIDECQELFSHPEMGKEAGELAEKIIKLGRALGIVLLLATQRPDAKSLPTGVSANVGTRFCLRVMGQVENDMILGTSAYRNGIRATMFTRRDKGVGYLVGATDEAQIVRTFYVDGPAAARVCQRGRTLREQAGTLTGHAAGQATTTPAATRRDTLLDDILTVVPATEAKVWTETVLDRLTGLRPDVYAGMTRDQLTAALRPYGITTGQVWGTDPATGKGANRRGIERQHITEAVAERNRRRRDEAA